MFLTVDDRAGEARAVAVQLRPDVGHQRQELSRASASVDGVTVTPCNLSLGAHPVVLRIVLELRQAQRLQHGRQVHAEASAQPLFEAVPALDRVVGGAPQASTVPSAAAFCSSALPSSTQSPFFFSIAWRSAIARSWVAQLSLANLNDQGWRGRGFLA